MNAFLPPSSSSEDPSSSVSDLTPPHRRRRSGRHRGVYPQPLPSPPTASPTATAVAAAANIQGGRTSSRRRQPLPPSQPRSDHHQHPRASIVGSGPVAVGYETTTTTPTNAGTSAIEYAALEMTLRARLSRVFDPFQTLFAHAEMTSVHEPPSGFTWLSMYATRTNALGGNLTCAFAGCDAQAVIGAHLRYTAADPAYASWYIAPACSRCNRQHGLAARLRTGTQLVRILDAKQRIPRVLIGRIPSAAARRLMEATDARGTAASTEPIPSPIRRLVAASDDVGIKVFGVDSAKVEDLKVKVWPHARFALHCCNVGVGWC